MKKGQVVTAKVTGLHFPNRAICQITGSENTEDIGKTIRVKNGIPGQTISVRVAKLRHGNPEGALLEVLEQGPSEYAFSDEEHVCPRFPECGGCMYQTLPYEEQLRVKTDMMRELFAPVLGADVFDSLFEGITESPDRTEYRNKMEFSFGDRVKDGPLELGMHRRGSFYDIEDASVCRIVDSDFRQAVRITRDWFRRAGVTFLHKNSHEGYLRHLLVRKGRKSGQILIDLVTTTQDPWGAEFKNNDVKSEPPAGIAEAHPDRCKKEKCKPEKCKSESDLLEGWKEQLQKADWKGTLTGVLHTRNDRLSDVVMDEGTEILFGQDYFEEELLGLSFKITPFSFFQTNSLGAEKLYAMARDFVLQSDESGEKLKGKTVYDLYSGTGTIAQILSPSAGHVVGVEIVPEAVEAARENARKNGITNCEFLCGDVLKTLDQITEKPDMIVLDPPRDGVNPKALKQILDYDVREILYISCKPTSLARDIPAMEEAGYQVVRMAGMDMFPSTPNVEVCALLKKR